MVPFSSKVDISYPQGIVHILRNHLGEGSEMLMFDYGEGFIYLITVIK